jgi:hypothetical protein
VSISGFDDLTDSRGLHNFADADGFGIIPTALVQPRMAGLTDT